MQARSSSRTRSAKEDGSSRDSDCKIKNQRKKRKLVSKTSSTGLSSVKDLTQPHDFCDVVLVVEGKKLHFSRSLLQLVSPVFKAMFSSSYVEKTSNEIPLPGKTFDAVHTLLQWILPSVRCPVTEENVFLLLPLSEEYCIPTLRYECMDFLIKLVKTQPPDAARCSEILEVAELFDLTQLIQAVANHLAEYDWMVVQKLPFYLPLQTKTQVCLLTARMKKIETTLESHVRRHSSVSNGLMDKLEGNNKRYTQKQEEIKKLEDKLEKTREAVLAIESAWKFGTKGVCPEHETVKVEGNEQKRNFSCPKCIQFFGFFLKTTYDNLNDRDGTDRYSVMGY